MFKFFNIFLKKKRYERKVILMEYFSYYEKCFFDSSKKVWFCIILVGFFKYEFVNLNFKFKLLESVFILW